MLYCMDINEKSNEETDFSEDGLRFEIGSNLRFLRDEESKRRVVAGEEKLTLAVMAKELRERGHSVTDGQLGHIESARRFPSMSLLLTLADYYQTSLDYIF